MRDLGSSPGNGTNLLGNRADPSLILLCHTNKDPQCWPFQQQPARRLQSHPKQLWGAAESGFCKQRGGLLYLSLLITLLNNNYKLYHSFTYNFTNK